MTIFKGIGDPREKLG